MVETKHKIIFYEGLRIKFWNQPRVNRPKLLKLLHPNAHSEYLSILVVMVTSIDNENSAYDKIEMTFRYSIAALDVSENVMHNGNLALCVNRTA